MRLNSWRSGYGFYPPPWRNKAPHRPRPATPLPLQQLLCRVGSNANAGAKLNIICHHDVEIVDGLADLLSNPLGRISIGIAEDQGKLVTTKTAGQIRRTLAEGLQKMAHQLEGAIPI